MKKIWMLLLLLAVQLNAARAQSYEVKQLLLDVEKLAQFKQILADLKKGYTILSAGYNTIRDISQGNFNLHKAFLDGLLAVSPLVRKYRKVAGILSMQVLLVKEYKNANARFRAKGIFSAGELEHIGNVYSKLFDESVHDLEALANVITAGKLRMNDDERLNAIDGLYAGMEDKLVFLRHFNNSTSILSIQRSREQHDVDVMRQLYDVK